MLVGVDWLVAHLSTDIIHRLRIDAVHSVTSAIVHMRHATAPIIHWSAFDMHKWHCFEREAACTRTSNEVYSSGRHNNQANTKVDNGECGE